MYVPARISAITCSDFTIKLFGVVVLVDVYGQAMFYLIIFYISKFWHMTFWMLQRWLNAILQLCGGKASEGVFVGAFLSMSSTAVVYQHNQSNSISFLKCRRFLFGLLVVYFGFGFLYTLFWFRSWSFWWKRTPLMLFMDKSQLGPWFCRYLVSGCLCI